MQYKLIFIISLLGLVACKTAEYESTEGGKAAYAFGSRDDIVKFVEEVADSRLMELAEGKLAQQKSATPEIQQFARHLAEDQVKLFQDLREMASARNIDIPTRLSTKRSAGLEALQHKSGKSFDNKFIKMVIIDHRQDIRIFKKAATLADGDVKSFAQQYLPLLEAHLAEIEKISRAY
jgi:putative membrane protein